MAPRQQMKMVTTRSHYAVRPLISPDLSRRERALQFQAVKAARRGKMKEYYVSGVIQIRVKAESAPAAIEKANRKVMSLHKYYPTVDIDLENIATKDHCSVDMFSAEEVKELDAPPPPPDFR